MLNNYEYSDCYALYINVEYVNMSTAMVTRSYVNFILVKVLCMSMKHAKIIIIICKFIYHDCHYPIYRGYNKISDILVNPSII